MLGHFDCPRTDDDAVDELHCGSRVGRRGDAEAGVEGKLGRCARASGKRGQSGGEAVASAGRSGQGYEIEPTVRPVGSDPDPLVRGRRRDELDALEVRARVGREVGDDHARRAGRPSLFREAFVAEGLEQRRVGHRDQRHVDAPTDLGQAGKAGVRAHTVDERPLGSPANHGPVREWVREREAKLDDVRAGLHRRLGEFWRRGAAHQVDDERLHGDRRRD